MTRKGHALLFYQGKSKMNGGKTMNIRKNIDYSEMYKDLDDLMAKEEPPEPPVLLLPTALGRLGAPALLGRSGLSLGTLTLGRPLIVHKKCSFEG